MVNPDTSATCPESHEVQQIQSNEPNRANIKKSALVIIGISLFLNFLVTAGMICVYDQVFSVKIKVVDLRAYKTDVVNSLTEGRISQADVLPMMVKLNEKLRNEDPHKNTIILLKEVVAHGNVTEIKP